jgi:hypothetical protein
MTTGWVSIGTAFEPLANTEDCGTGVGGFKKGNTCARGGKSPSPDPSSPRHPSKWKAVIPHELGSWDRDDSYPVRPEDLGRELELAREDMVEVAQDVYNGWEQNETGRCSLRGEGGACDDIAAELVGAVSHRVAGIEAFHIHVKDHVFPAVRLGDRAFVYDIPPEVYETGSKKKWTKKRDVRFKPSDVVIEEVDPKLLVKRLPKK